MKSPFMHPAEWTEVRENGTNDHMKIRGNDLPLPKTPHSLLKYLNASMLLPVSKMICFSYQEAIVEEDYFYHLLVVDAFAWVLCHILETTAISHAQ